ncbi:MAG: barnase inhibitor [Alphaproteobacteria bacterium]|nr:barnase inhibitor [Alphaproteobacteria bacterium]MBM3651123.1 barnase inhibitor [Alphaproteobacteria bacterium]
MKTVTLDASHDTMEAIYNTLQRELGLPAHFGRNLDALWDALTGDVAGPLEIVWRDHAWARPKLGSYYDRLIKLLRDLESERADFKLILT